MSWVADGLPHDRSREIYGKAVPQNVRRSVQGDAATAHRPRRLASRAALLAAATLAAAGTGGLNPSLEVPITGTWQCLADRGGDLRRLRGRNPAFRG
jgi:anti-sigma factor RsiW